MVSWNGVVGEDVGEAESMGVEGERAGEVGGDEGEVIDAVGGEGGVRGAGGRESEGVGGGGCCISNYLWDVGGGEEAEQCGGEHCYVPGERRVCSFDRSREVEMASVGMEMLDRAARLLLDGGACKTYSTTCDGILSTLMVPRSKQLNLSIRTAVSIR